MWANIARSSRSFELALRSAGIVACNLSEHHSFGESHDVAGDYAEELAAEMLATTLGLDFDPGKSWDEKKEVYRLSNQIVRTQNITQTAVGGRKVLWTTVMPRRS